MTVLPLLALLSCTGPAPEPAPSPLLGVDSTATWEIEGLNTRGYVVYTEMGIPHIYATSTPDAGRLLGFTVARDRFFLIDMVRRLSHGTVSELFGELGLDSDIESRGLSTAYIAKLVHDDFTPEQLEWAEGYADGVNAYIDAVKAEKLLPPSEYEAFYVLLGRDDAAGLMEPFTSYDVAAMITTIIFRLGFETGDAGRARDYQALMTATDYDGVDLEDLRKEGRWTDVWHRVDPPNKVSSTEGWGESGTKPRSTPHILRPPLPPAAPMMLERAKAKGERIQARLGRDHDMGWGSNSWAVAGTHTTDGRALLAGDGHLELEVPTLMTQIHIDTAHLGADNGLTIYGDLIIGVPLLATGTNGKVAWGFTQLMGDISDMYADQIQLDENGAPMAAMYQDSWVPMVKIEETYNVATVTALDSEGGTQVWPRYETADGRFLYDIEGRSASPGDELAAGETLLNVAGDWVVPGDTDGDGIVTAITFDFTGLDGGSLFGMMWDRLKAQDVVDVAESTKKAQSLSMNTVAADANGDIFFTGYQMTPCRSYLEKNADGSWAAGADPTMLIDGNKYKGFTVPLNEDLSVDESSDDPYKCVVPWEEYPHSFTPDHGYLSSANNDPGGITFDNDLTNEPYYMAGPWIEGFRAEAIDRRLKAATEGGFADLAEMSAIQGDHQSLVGRQFVPHLLGAIEKGQQLAAQDFTPPVGSSDERLLAIYMGRRDEIDEVHTRLTGWSDRGFEAASGVVTFYNPVLAPNELDDAVATMIWNTYQGDMFRDAINDEGFRGNRPTGATGRTRIFKLMLQNRGNNDDGLASWNPDTQESAFWDDLATPGIIEESDEILLGGLPKALDFLASAPTGDAEGGFGTTDMNEWVWGMRHQVRFASLLAGFIDDPVLAPILDQFSITTDRVTLDPAMSPVDPRQKLKWFPRPGDMLGIDAANNSSSGRSFTHGSGPVMRQVIALGADGAEGSDIVNGGQSGVAESPHFDDQVKLWLANETVPMRMKLDDVIAGAERRETFTPKGWTE